MAAESSRRSDHFGGVFKRPQRPQKPTLPSVPTKTHLVEAQAATNKEIPTVPSELVNSIDQRDQLWEKVSGSSTGHLANTETKKEAYSESRRAFPRRLGQPWKVVTRLGTLVQGSSKLLLGASKERFGDLVMFREMEEEHGSRELDILETLSHPNIIRVREVFVQDCRLFIGFEYFRFTLQELTHVHLRMEETQIQLIARSVFPAIHYLFVRGLVHNAISLQSIRVSNRKPILVLSDFESCQQRYQTQPQTDFEALAAVLIQCMDETPPLQASDSTTAAQIDTIKSQRLQVFGIEDAERWSGCKQLIDFLDDLLNKDKPPLVKLEKPHAFVREQVDSRRADQQALLPFVELTTLECFTLWHAHE